MDWRAVGELLQMEIFCKRAPQQRECFVPEMLSSQSRVVML